MWPHSRQWSRECKRREFWNIFEKQDLSRNHADITLSALRLTPFPATLSVHSRVPNTPDSIDSCLWTAVTTRGRAESRQPESRHAPGNPPAQRASADLRRTERRGVLFR